MKAIYDGQYKKTGNDGILRTTTVFKVLCNKAEKVAFQNAQGEHYRENAEGIPLFFTTNPIGKEMNLVISKEGKVCIDDSELTILESVAKRFPHLAKAMAQDKNLLNKKQDAPVQEPSKPLDNE